MFENFRRKLDSSPPRALVIFAWVWIFLVFLFATGVLVTNHRVQQEGSALGENNIPPSPRIFSVIVPSEASPGNEVIIRGGKFGSRGQVCFRLSQEIEEPSTCPHQFDVLVWTSGSIRAQIPEIEKGEGTLWVVMGEGEKSNEVNFVIE